MKVAFSSFLCLKGGINIEAPPLRKSAPETIVGFGSFRGRDGAGPRRVPCGVGKKIKPPEPSLALEADAFFINNLITSAISISDYILKQSHGIYYAIVTFAYDNPSISPLQILADGCSAFLDKHLIKLFRGRQNRFA